MDNFKVTTTLEQSDWAALLQAIGSRMRERMREETPVLLRFLFFPFWILVGFGIFWLTQASPGTVHPESFFAAFFLITVFWWIQNIRQRRVIRPASDGAFLGKTDFDFRPDGFDVVRASSSTRNSWRMMRDVTRTATHVFLWIDHISAYTFRVADIPAPLTPDEAVSKLRGFLAGGQAEARATAEETPALARDVIAAPVTTPTPAAPELPTAMQEFSALLRLEFQRAVDPAHLYGRDLTLILGALFSFGLWIGLDRLNYENAEFMWYAVPSLAAVIAPAFLFAWILSRLSTPRLPFRRTLLLVVACSPIFAFAVWLSSMVGEKVYYVVSVVAIVWIARLVVTGLRAMTGSTQYRAVGVAFLCLVLAQFSSAGLFFSAGVWYEPDPDESSSGESAINRDQLLFEQASRIDAQVAAMKPGDPQLASSWFVGFAGFGEQRVFAEEIGTAARVIGAKYASEGRQLLLVNDRRDEQKYPFATVPALRHGLMALGKRMNVETDVLFLALSSHGSEDATISVSNEAMMFWRDLGAADLRSMLDESGIRWRVIVVSACHAGSFIDALADERTIVLTAAARENTSFGCSDDRDLTYFGEVFYRDALPAAPSLRAAFDRARLAISKRESEEHIEPSDPQAHYGAELERKLADMQPSIEPGGGTQIPAAARLQ